MCGGWNSRSLGQGEERMILPPSSVAQIPHNVVYCTFDVSAAHKAGMLGSFIATAEMAGFAT